MHSGDRVQSFLDHRPHKELNMNTTKKFQIGIMITLIIFILIGYSVGYHFGSYFGHDITRRVEQAKNN